jgi:hypothetical protein
MQQFSNSELSWIGANYENNTKRNTEAEINNRGFACAFFAPWQFKYS